MPRILVTSMGSTAAQNLVWALRRQRASDWFVVGADMRARHGGIGLADEDVTVPRGSKSESYLGTLRAHIDTYSPDVVVAVMEPELLTVAHAPEGTFEGTDLLCSSPHAIGVCRSKRILASAFARAGLDAPEVVDAADASAHRFPLFARPDQGSGSVHAERITSASHLALYLERTKGLDVAFTECVDGPEFSVDGFASAERGLVHAVCRSRDEVRHGLAVRSTVAPMREDVRAGLEALVRDLGLRGFFNLQYRVDAQGRARCFDLNPRLGGAMALSFAGGLEPASLLMAECAGGSWPELFEERVGLSLHRRFHNTLFEPDAP